MSRRRWIYRGTEAIEVGGDYVFTSDGGPAYYIIGDKNYHGLTSPIDGSDISTKTKHRNHMREKGVTTVDDFTNHFKVAAKERAEFYKNAPDKSRIQDVAAAFQKLRRS